MTDPSNVYQLWDDLGRFPLSGIDEACRHLMTTLAGWLGADNAAWIGTIRILNAPQARRDPLRGWRAKIISHLHPPDEAEMVAMRRALSGRKPEPGLTSIAATQLSGTFRVHRLYDGFVELAAFFQTDHYRSFYEALSVHDRLWVASPISPQAESFFVFDKRNNGSRFTEEDAKLAGLTLRALTRFQRDLLCSHGLLVARSPLTLAERRVAQLLLTPLSEKEIALKLNQSPHTTHTHIKEIFRKFSVNTRAGLMSVWLSHQ